MKTKIVGLEITRMQPYPVVEEIYHNDLDEKISRIGIYGMIGVVIAIVIIQIAL